MFSDAFGALLSELGRYLDISDLHPDELNTCTLSFNKKDTQLQLSANDDISYLKIYCELGELPTSGRFKEDVMHEALRANEMTHPRYGNFGFSYANNNLILWDSIPLKQLNGADLAEYLTKFIDKAADVRDSLKNNQIPSLVARTAMRTGGLFGIR